MIRVVVQSRLSSSRLPAKAMLMLGGMPMVVLAARRASNSGLDTVVATSDAPDDDIIAVTVAEYGIRCFRGPLDDTLERFRAATEDLNDDDVVVRMTADNVVPDGQLVLDLVSSMKDEYSRTDSQLPYGVSIECFTVRILRDAARSATKQHDREHVTPWIRRHTLDRPFMPEDAPVRRGLRCTVDTIHDFVRASRVLQTELDAVSVPWRELMRVWPNEIGQGRWILGTAQLGLDYGATNTLGLLTTEKVNIVLDAATLANVTHVDTARAYGQSEARLNGTWTGGIITKLCPLTADANGASAELSFAESLKSLGRERVDVLLVHRWDDWMKPGVADALSHICKSQGARLIGASVQTPRELVSALDDSRVNYVQLPFNLLDRRWLTKEIQSALDSRTDVIVTVRSVLLQGLLAANAETKWPSVDGVDPEAIRAAVVQLTAELRRESAVDLCIAYVLGHTFVTSAVLGAETAEQVTELARLAANAPLTAEEIALVNERIPAGPITLVDPARWEWK